MRKTGLAVTLCGVFLLGTRSHASDTSVTPSAPEVPSALQVASPEKLSFLAKAKGVQIYQWLPKKDYPAQYEWAFKGPEADLFDAHGEKIGHHYAGPTWEASDGSKVTGAMKGHVDSKSPDSVPWLLLSAKTHAW